MEPDSREYLEMAISVLSQDIAMFGPAGNDLPRLQRYKEKLRALNAAEGVAA